MPYGPLPLATVTGHLAAGRDRLLRGGSHGRYVLRDSGGNAALDLRIRAGQRADGHTRASLRRRKGRKTGREEPVAGPVASGRCGRGQQAGQMALDMWPWSTCRRLTKAIPVPDMAEAWHGGLDSVQHCP
ncbi:hypothetical protein STXM2123_5892 [Streptomyces sp. F-3]|nr:hypothetical protein STXM2123_5892 [Streptomyces sp. F-3]